MSAFDPKRKSSTIICYYAQARPLAFRVSYADDCGNEQFANSRHRPRVTRGAPNDYDSTAALPAGVTESQPPRFKLPILVG
jgi:hypothetical protein